MPRPFLPYALAIVPLLVSTSAYAVDFALTSNYPRRSNISRTVLGSSTSTNGGINTNDCLDVGTNQSVIGPDDSGQYWTFRFQKTGTVSPTNLEIWASTSSGSCVASGTGTIDRGKTPPVQCYRVAKFVGSSAFTNELYVKPIQMMGAVNSGSSSWSLRDCPVSSTADSHYNYSDLSSWNKSDICVAGDMSMTEFYLHFILTSNSSDTPTVVQDSSSNYEELIYPSSTTTGLYYDLGGPAAPTDLSIGAGNTLIYMTVNGSTTITSGTDILGYNAYCVAGSVSDAGSDSTSSSSDAASDSGDSSTTTTSSCAGALCQGSVPGIDFDTSSYYCGDVTSTTGKIKITGINGNSLQNNTQYCVFVAGHDRQGNAGPLSAPLCTTPKETRDFYTQYASDGGTAGGGFCNIGMLGSHSAQAAWGTWAALSLLILRRKKKL